MIYIGYRVHTSILFYNAKTRHNNYGILKANLRQTKYETHVAFLVCSNPKNTVFKLGAITRCNHTTNGG